MILHQQTFCIASSEPADSNKSCCRLPVFWANHSNKTLTTRVHSVLTRNPALPLFPDYFITITANISGIKQVEFSETTLRRERKQKGAAMWPTCALVLQALAVVALLADAVVLPRVCATLAARHHVAAVSACFTQWGASDRVVLDVVAGGQVWGRRTARGEHLIT